MGREAMKCRETTRSSSGAGAYPSETDANALKRGVQTGLETLVVHALNAAYSLLGCLKQLGGIANALNTPLGEYGRKAES